MKAPRQPKQPKEAKEHKKKALPKAVAKKGQDSVDAMVAKSYQLANLLSVATSEEGKPYVPANICSKAIAAQLGLVEHTNTLKTLLEGDDIGDKDMVLARVMEANGKLDDA
eukprot:2136227-Pyramimonas_sp.AAC.1